MSQHLARVSPWRIPASDAHPVILYVSKVSKRGASTPVARVTRAGGLPIRCHEWQDAGLGGGTRVPGVAVDDHRALGPHGPVDGAGGPAGAVL